MIYADPQAWAARKTHPNADSGVLGKFEAHIQNPFIFISTLRKKATKEIHCMLRSFFGLAQILRSTFPDDECVIWEQGRAQFSPIKSILLLRVFCSAIGRRSNTRPPSKVGVQRLAKLAVDTTCAPLGIALSL